MHWDRLWIPSGEDFRLTVMLFSLVMALIIGLPTLPGLRPYARRVSLLAMAGFAAFVVGLILWRGLHG